MSNGLFGSFKTIPNPLRQLSAKNLIISEAHLESIKNFPGLLRLIGVAEK
jgi:hypothetical protein